MSYLDTHETTTAKYPSTSKLERSKAQTRRLFLAPNPTHGKKVICERRPEEILGDPEQSKC